jgi:cytochrome c
MPDPMKPALTLALALAFAGPALADGDAEKGAKVFGKCKTCHAVGADAKNRVGPVLNGIVGRLAASVEGFKYSDALLAKNAEGFTWTEEAIEAYLANPKEYLPGNKMVFVGLKKEDDREDVIAYLRTFP